MSAPVKNTCPDIDKCIVQIKEAIKAVMRGRKEYPEAEDYFWDILTNIDDLEGRLEDLRKDNSALRDWGHSLESELHTAAETIAELENEEFN